MQVFTWPQKKREFTTLAFDATGRYLAAGGGRNVTVVWDAVTGAERGRYQAAQAALGFSPVGNRLVVPTKLGLWVHALGEEGSFARFAVPHTVGALAVHPTRDVAVCCYQAGFHHAIPLDTPNGEAVWAAPVGDLPNEYGHAFALVALGGDLFASSEYLYDTSRTNGRSRVAVRSWDDGRLRDSLSDKVLGYGDHVLAGHGATLVIQSGVWLRFFRADAPDAPPRSVRNDGRKHFTGAAFHPSGAYLAATSNDETVKLYDAATWRLARTFTWDIGKMRSIAFSPDGTLAAAGSDKGQVAVWDVDL